ncbi:MAG: hypothetical protein NTX07_08865 [Solirubrobacterales bacterium]|nr:hypothetical protein [Solirubrobacterales bacterium]
MLVTVAASAAAAAPAYASSAVTGDPWVDQYIEQVPNATGEVKTGNTKSRSGLSRQQVQYLSNEGGDRFSSVVAATVPGGPGSGGPGSGGTSSSSTASVSVPSVPAALGTAIEGDSGGLGLVLPAALIGSVIGAFALAVSRQRRNHS